MRASKQERTFRLNANGKEAHLSIKRTIPALMCVIGFGALVMSFSASSLHAAKRLSFTQQDKIASFDFATGLGAMTGTATGEIKGVTNVNFQWIPTGPTTFTYSDRVGITDTDGDQIIFRGVGTGTFLTTPLLDPTLGGNPGTTPYQVFGNALGGPLTGTYEVIASSGKYTGLLAQTFQTKRVVYNLSSPPAPAGTLGTSYTEISQ
jgi:hypothetical protein